LPQVHAIRWRRRRSRARRQSSRSTRPWTLSHRRRASTWPRDQRSDLLRPHRDRAGQ